MILLSEYEKAKELESEIKNLQHIILLLENKSVFDDQLSFNINQATLSELHKLLNHNKSKLSELIMEE